jgi:hypothetical protein
MMDEVVSNCMMILDIKESDFVLLEGNKINRVSSYDTISTYESKPTNDLDDLELLIEDLISGHKTLSDLPDYILKHSDEITRLPKRPRKPEDWECCGSGCCPCVWDIYDRDLEIHERSVQEVCEKVREGS